MYLQSFPCYIFIEPLLTVQATLYALTSASQLFRDCAASTLKVGVNSSYFNFAGNT